MMNSLHLPRPALRCSLQSMFFLILLVGALVVGATTAAQAQTFTVLHSFGGPEGASPEAGLILDAAGNLYGTTTYGGSQNCGNGGCGTVFKMTHKPGGWVLTTLYVFQGGSDSGWPRAGLVFGPDGTLYGTTQRDHGTVFNLRPPATVCRAVSCP